jgi:hypothetical protein
MIARALFPFHSARLHAPSRPPSKSSISPTYDRFTSNSFVSPAYAKTGGCTPTKMSARQHLLSLFSQSLLSALFPFNCLRTLSFSVSYISPIPPAPSALFPKKRGYPTLVTPIPPRLLARHSPLHPSARQSPITSHFRGQTNVMAAGGRRVLQRCFSLRGAAARIAASNGWAWSNGSERRKRSARRA